MAAATHPHPTAHTVTTKTKATPATVLWPADRRQPVPEQRPYTHASPNNSNSRHNSNNRIMGRSSSSLTWHHSQARPHKVEAQGSLMAADTWVTKMVV